MDLTDRLDIYVQALADIVVLCRGQGTLNIKEIQDVVRQASEDVSGDPP